MSILMVVSGGLVLSGQLAPESEQSVTAHTSRPRPDSCIAGRGPETPAKKTMRKIRGGKMQQQQQQQMRRRLAVLGCETHEDPALGGLTL